MWSVVDIILTSKTPIHTYCTGRASSAALKIFLAGHKRFVSSHATFLYHQLSHSIEGTYTDLVQDLAEDTYTQNEIEKHVMSRTKITKEKLDEIREKKIDWFIHANEAIELGIAHEIIT